MSRGFAAAWCVVMALATVDALWAQRVGMAVGGVQQTGFACTLLAAVAAFYGHTGRSERLCNLAESAALWIAFSAAAVVFSYAAATLRLPLCDAAFAAADRALGFDWPAWFDWVQRHPTARWPLAVAYWSLMPQILGTLLFLATTGRFRQQTELLLAAILAFLVTAPLSGIFPAGSAWVHFGVQGSVDAYHWTDFSALRSGLPTQFRLPDMTGIITFPSFHAALGVLLVHAHRSCRPLLAASLVLNGLLVLSVPSEGGHYLVDALAGAAIALAAIGAVRLGMRRSVRPASGGARFRHEATA